MEIQSWKDIHQNIYIFFYEPEDIWAEKLKKYYNVVYRAVSGRRIFEDKVFPEFQEFINTNINPDVLCFELGVNDLA